MEHTPILSSQQNRQLASYKNNPEEKSGIVWHTQGSGKSLSMVFLVKKIRGLEKTKNLKIVIVTDRTDLQTQLKETAGIAEKPYVVGGQLNSKKNSELIQVIL